MSGFEVCCLLCMAVSSSPVFLQLLREEIWACLMSPCLGLGMGMMCADFQAYDMVLVFRTMFNVCVRYVSPSGPKCFKCIMLMLSGPIELLFLFCLTTSWTYLVVSCVGVACCRWIRLSMSLSVLCFVWYCVYESVCVFCVVLCL